MNKLLLFIVVLFTTSLTANAQCVPNGQTTTGASYILPDSATGFVHGCAGKPYEQIIYMKVPKDTSVVLLGTNQSFKIDSFVINKNIVGLPMGLSVVSNPATLPAGGVNNYERLIIKGDSLACVKIFGTIDGSVTPGDKPLTINVRAYMRLLVLGTPTTPIDTPASVTDYKIVIDAPGTGVCIPAATSDIEKYGFELKNAIPNPAENYTQISFNSTNTNVNSVEITDMMGKVMYHQKVKSNIGSNYINIDTKSFAKGMYIYSMANGSQRISKKLIIK